MIPAACVGIACPKRGQCRHYADVESWQRHATIRTCRTAEGEYPCFELHVPVPKPVAVPSEGEGSDVD